MKTFFLLTPLFSYLIGGIPFGFIIAKSRGIDIREHGSGNIGATNVGRTLGKKWGILCFIFDFLKGCLPVVLCKIIGAQLVQDSLITLSGYELMLIASAFATVAGHIFTPYLQFKGGKGVATTAGAIFVLAPYAILCAILGWIITLKISKYVGLASVIAAIVLPISAVVMNISAKPALKTAESTIILLSVLSALSIFRHRGNIQRILQGTEPKIGQKKEQANEDSSSE
ncbi:MAG: glycerol-3-phosphate 1-O-acyltransferase PlsY [Lentisphaeria bacterium]|nr:glycerol-3-phosphate 1-O-acyltransferase PlsY [Lentisphaeria bacterium]